MSFAQTVPNIGRWGGSTAQSQAQGFSQGDPLRLTWGFAQEGMNVPEDGDWRPDSNDVRGFFNGIYGAGSQSTTWQPLFASVFDRWSQLSGLQYSFEANDDGGQLTEFDINRNFVAAGLPGQTGVRADVRIAAKPLDGPSGVLAYNFFPTQGDMVIDSNDTFYSNTGGNSIRLRDVVSHEHGHGIGMPHVESGNAAFLMEPFINTNFDGPQYHDILQAHRGYGDVNEKSNSQAGNDAFGLATGLGTIGDMGVAMIGGDAVANSLADLSVGANEVDFVSVDDATDTDFYSFTIDQGSLVDINLDALGFTYLIGAQDNNPGTNGTPFDTTMRSNLALSIHDTDGSLLATMDANGFGLSEAFAGFSLANAGTYFVSVTGADNPDTINLDTQFYSLSIGVSAITMVPEPATASILGLFTVGAFLRRRRIG